MKVEQGPTPVWARHPEIRVGAVIALALAVGFVVWLLVIRGGGGSSKSGSGSIAASAASPDRLRSLADDVGHPIYWAGPAENSTYELTKTSSGNIYVRYLPQGTPIGTKEAGFTIVGTYPVKNAYNVLNELARKGGESSFPAPRGGFAVYARSSPNHIYVAYPDVKDVQIEVYDSSSRHARSLISSGRVAPVR